MGCLRAWLGSLIGSLLLAAGHAAPVPTAYFVDGYHGGVYGHYPTNFTRFIVDSLREHPDWRINLEIEPATWDFVRTNEPEAYAEFSRLAADQSVTGRIEFVNPAYGQSYLWNISGESVIQQLAHGMNTIRRHFPGAEFTTYSSEEPCFTSALPGILSSFGFKYAALKNPNTCWGGYMRADGGELVNWVGSDGSRILTVPRYGMETLRPGSTWETIANANSPEYVRAALAAGIQHPVGMCLQDAGWRFGPWLAHVGNYYQPTEATLWRNYFEHVADRREAPDRRFSQEDVQVSLVWGAPVLQRIAQQVRGAENRLVMAEKLASLAEVYGHEAWPRDTLDEAWRTLLLSQHHDCWIVPYNRHGRHTWAGWVAEWTAETSRRSDEVISRSTTVLTGGQADGKSCLVRVFNTLAEERTNLVEASLPAGWDAAATRVKDAAGAEVPMQATDESVAGPRIVIRAACPPLGFSTYRLEAAQPRLPAAGPTVVETNGLMIMETDLYRLVVDRQRGGTIRSLVAKKLRGNELVDGAQTRRFGEIRGYFREAGRFLSNADQPATIERLEVGPVRVRVRIRGQIGSNAVTQVLTLVQGEPRIDYSVRIDWQGSPEVGSSDPGGGRARGEDDGKGFYDERGKLLVQFPLNQTEQRIFKDAPFDVVTSALTNTFFDRWSEIKNNIILNWVDAFDPKEGTGVCLLTDHTGSYVQDTDHTLGLTLLYSGPGLWGRDYTIDGATEVHYALLPHAGDWQQADLWNAARLGSEPLLARVFSSSKDGVEWNRSLLQIQGGGWEVPTMRVGTNEILVRIFNPSSANSTKTLRYHDAASKVELVELNGQVRREIPSRQQGGETWFEVTLPSLGIGTLRIAL
jgi:alpha-mannosidase